LSVISVTVVSTQRLYLIGQVLIEVILIEVTAKYNNNSVLHEPTMIALSLLLNQLY